MDLSTTYRSIIKKYFPNASIVADRFHVHRMLTRLVNKLRKRITGDERKNPIRKLLLRNQKNLSRDEVYALNFFLNVSTNRELKEVYEYKEALNRFYRIKGHKRARRALIKLLDRMGKSKIPKVSGIRATLLNWQKEILEYFRKNRLSNGRVEGFNRKAKLLQRKAYGYSSFKNYRLRLLGESSVKGFERSPTIK
jgi:transposase